MAEPRALRRTLDQPGDVGEDELALAVVDRAEHRLERRERVVGDLRRRPGEAGEQRRLAGVRQADQAGVGQQPELQLDPAGGPGQAALGEARRLVGGGGEALVPVPAEPAGGDDRLAVPARPGRSTRPRAPRRSFPAGPARSCPRRGRRGGWRPGRGRRGRRGSERRRASRRGRGARSRRRGRRLPRGRRRRRRARRAGRAPRGGSETTPSPPRPPSTNMRARSWNTQRGSQSGPRRLVLLDAVLDA